MVAVNALAKLPLFESMPRAELARIAGCFQPRQLVDGEALFTEGEVASSACLLAQGELVVLSALPGGGEVRLARLGPGSLFGEMALITGAHRTATVRADGDAVAFTIASRPFQASLEQSSLCAYRILQHVTATLAARLVEVQAQIVAFWSRTGRAPPGPGASATLVPVRVHGTEVGFDYKGFLPRLPIFVRFEAQLVDELVAQCQILEFHRGAMLFREGEAAGACHVVVRGALERSVIREGRHQLEILGPGRLCGANALIQSGACRSDASARTDAVVLRLDRGDFEALFSGESAVCLAFQRAVSLDQLRSLRAANNLLTTLTSQARIRARVPAV